VIEISIVFGALVIGAAQFALQDSSRAVANLLVFMAAGARIAPAILRVQQGLIGIKSGLGRAEPTLELFTLLSGKEYLSDEKNILSFDHFEFKSDIEVNNVSFNVKYGPRRKGDIASSVLKNVSPYMRNLYTMDQLLKI
jgi:hypothetical protein